MSISLCRGCAGEKLTPVLSLGTMALANALRSEQQLTQDEQIYPLELVLCEQCTLCQINETVPPEELFSQYTYFSSYSDTMLRHAAKLVQTLIDDRGLDEDSLVVEIASNDGYLLKNYCARGVQVLGIEPAQNIAKVANERGVDTLCRFFGEEVADLLVAEGVKADVCLLYTSPSPRDATLSRMPSSA